MFTTLAQAAAASSTDSQPVSRPASAATSQPTTSMVDQMPVATAAVAATAGAPCSHETTAHLTTDADAKELPRQLQPQSSAAQPPATGAEQQVAAAEAGRDALPQSQLQLADYLQQLQDLQQQLLGLIQQSQVAPAMPPSLPPLPHLGAAQRGFGLMQQYPPWQPLQQQQVQGVLNTGVNGGSLSAASTEGGGTAVEPGRQTLLLALNCNLPLWAPYAPSLAGAGGQHAAWPLALNHTQAFTSLPGFGSSIGTSSNGAPVAAVPSANSLVQPAAQAASSAAAAASSAAATLRPGSLATDAANPALARFFPASKPASAEEVSALELLLLNEAAVHPARAVAVPAKSTASPHSLPAAAVAGAGLELGSVLPKASWSVTAGIALAALLQHQEQERLQQQQQQQQQQPQWRGLQQAQPFAQPPLAQAAVPGPVSHSLAATAAASAAGATGGIDMTQFAASSGHLAALLKPIAMAASGTLPDGRGFASAPSDAAGAVMVPLALQPTRAESGPGTAGAADVFHRPAASGQWSSGVGHPSVSQLRAAAAESQARLHLQRRALVARSDHTASSPEGSPSETVQGQRRSAAATDAAGAPDKSAVGKRAMAASTPRRAAPTAHQSLASSGAGTGAGLPWPPAGTGSSCHSEQPSEEGRQELGSDGNGSPQSPPTTKRARRSSTGKIVLGASEDRQQQLRHLGYRIAGGVESLAPALAKLNKLTPGEMPRSRHGYGTRGTCFQCLRERDLHIRMVLCLACIKHNVSSAKHFMRHYAADPRVDLGLYVVATLSRLLANARHQCSCAHGPDPDCDCVFDEQRLTCIPCRFMRGLKFVILYNLWPTA